MAVNVVRYRTENEIQWGVTRDGRVTKIEGRFETTRDFMRDGAAAARRLSVSLDGPLALSLANLEVLSPITRDRQFLCQAINYYSHLRESGFDPVSNPFNIFFRKASSCLASATTPIRKPAHVEFLDYEVELGLVFSGEVEGPQDVREDNVHEFVGGFVLMNDVSARDIQIPEMQFYKGKSYRTFGPTGPFLTLVDHADVARFDELRLRLEVNGEERQNSLTSDMVHRPAKSLTELSSLQDWEAGDVLATGTPGGCALQAPPKPFALIAQMVSPRRRQSMIRSVGARNDRTLKVGDVVVASIRTDDGTIDLGTQRNEVVDA